MEGDDNSSNNSHSEMTEHIVGTTRLHHLLQDDIFFSVTLTEVEHHSTGRGLPASLRPWMARRRAFWMERVLLVRSVG